LTDAGLLARLERSIGGVRAGSAGYVYRLGPYGRRLVAYWNGQGLPRGRRPHEPGRLFVRHRLAVVDTYLRLVEVERQGRLELLDFEAEPACWRSYMTALGGHVLLKPDAFVQVALGGYADSYFGELDLGTEGRTTLARKARAYLDYCGAGTEQADTGVFPKVLWITTNRERCRTIASACASLPPEAWELFAVTTPARCVDLFAGGVEAAERLDDLAGGAA